MAVHDDPFRIFLNSPFVRLELVPRAVFNRQTSETRCYELFFAREESASDVQAMRPDLVEILDQHQIAPRLTVDIHWEVCDPDAEEAHTTDQSGPAAFRNAHVRQYLVVRVGRELAFHVPPGTLGLSLPDAQFGVSATIFQERVESLCRGEGQDFAMMPGRAIAHELGHVTLKLDGHAPTGIMRARWRRSDFADAAMGNLGFTPEQAASIRFYASR